MSVSLLQPEASAPARGEPLRAEDLAELLSAFNEVTARLQSTHETLSAEVSRLRQELGEANRQLRRARELAALGEMAAGIAHEIRNPLGSIKLYASALVEDLGDRPAECAIARKIAGGVSRLDAVVGDVLAFSREMRVRSAAVPVSVLIERAIEMAGVGESGAMRVSVRPGMSVSCDRGLVEQALANVVRNAFEAVRENARSGGVGGVEIDCDDGWLMDAHGRQTGAASIRVRDAGPGFPDGVRDRVFNPFFTTREAGTGLGLAIVHRIIDAHGGRVALWNNSEREPGAPGATVELILPASSGTVMEESQG